MVAKFLGWLFMAAAVFAGVRDGMHYHATRQIVFAPLGKLWYEIDAGSLNLVQAVIERYIHPFLWQNVVSVILQWSATITFGAIGIVLLLIGYASAGGKKRRR